MIKLKLLGACWASLGLVLAGSPSKAPAAIAPPTSRYCVDCPEMVVIPAGRFLMGSTEAETTRENMPADQAARERPQKTITIARHFALAQTEVTVTQYAAFAAATKRAAGECQVYFKVANVFTGWLPLAGSGWDNPPFPQASDHPVMCVSWDDAAAYATWLSTRSGRHFRLPSESEWEYAARGGTTTARYWGDGREEACRYANVADTTMYRHQFACTDGYPHTAPATYGIPNAYGLYGMLGNIGEWTADCGSTSLAQTPTDGSPKTTGPCVEHIGRGGSWWNDPYYIRAARRYSTEGRYFIMGFRVAMDLD